MNNASSVIKEIENTKDFVNKTGKNERPKVLIEILDDTILSLKSEETICIDNRLLNEPKKHTLKANRYNAKLLMPTEH